VIGLLAVTLATLFLNDTQLIVFNSPNLVFIFNLIFWPAASAIIVYASIRGFLRDGSRTVLLLTTSILIFAGASINSAFVQRFSDNFSLAIGGIGLLVASIIQLSASLLALFQKDESSSKNRKAQMTIAYSVALVFVALLSVVALNGWLPTFYSAGPTVLRQWIVATSVVFFGTAFIVYGTQYVRSRTTALLLYSLAIALLTLAFFGGFEIKKVGDLITWLSRISTYTSAVYIIAAFLAIRQLGAKTMTSWAETFRIDQRQADALFSNMLDAFIYAKVVTDVNGKPIDWIYLDVNNSFERISGVKKEQLIGKTVTSVFPKEIEDPADWIGTFGKVALTGEPIHLEGRGVVFGKWISVTVYSPKQGYFISIFDDITERKKAEEAMQESEEKFRNLAEESPNMIFINQGGRIVYANKKSEDVLGYTREELYSPDFSFLTLNPPEYIEAAKSAEAKHLKGEEVPPYEFAVITREGKRIDAIIATKLIDYHGKKAVMGIVTDITDRMKAEDALKQSEQRYRLLFSSMTEMFQVIELIYDKDGKVIDYFYREVNPAFEKLVGKTKEQLVDKRVKDIFGIVEDYWLEVYGKVAKTGEPAHFENYGAELDKWYEIYAWKANDKQLAIIFTDVTERKKAEDALRLSEVHYRTLFRSIGEGFELMELIFDENKAVYDLRFVEVNDTYEKQTGLKAKDVLGKTVRELFPDIEGMWIEVFDRVIKTGLPTRLEDYHQDTNRYYSAYYFPFGKKEVGVLFTDITERKQAEEKLEEYRNNLEQLVAERTKKLELSSLYARNLLEASLDPLVTISREGKITDANKAAEEVTGVSREELVGSDFSIYFTDPEKARTGYQQVFTEGFVKDYPLSIRHKSGKITDVLYNASIYRNPQGEIEGVFAAARDITERKIAEQKLKDAERLANIGATAGMVGHDIRNPLQAITGDLYLAKTELASIPDSEEKTNAVESLTEIEKNIDYINKIVQDLQDYARPLNPNPGEADLKLIIEKLLKKNGRPDNVKVRVKVEDDARKIVADSDYLNRILYNLVTNAVQAMPKGGRLAIHAFKEEKDTVITIKDTGVGIPKEIQAKIFTVMFTTKSKGQGFGLPVVKRMTESLGGTVSFESEEGKGTTFIIHLPQSPLKS